MNEARLRELLLEAPLPRAERERSFEVVRHAFLERERVSWPRRHVRHLVLAAAVLAVVGAALSPPGRAVLDDVREAIGIERAEPALFSLPAPGRLLVTSPAGPWVVSEDGSKRLLGSYRDASWSPFGRFVIAARSTELAALDPSGTVRWTLARPDIRFPRWGGTRADTRIAYLSGSRLHVVAGDGTGDVDAGGLPAAARVAPAWRPARDASGLVLAYSDTRGRIHAYAPDRGRLLFRTAPGPIPTKLEWSPDGRHLLALAPTQLRVFDGEGRIVARDDPSDGARDVDAAFLPGSNRLAVVRVHGGQTDVFVLDSGRVLFRTTGELRQVVPAPNGRWLLLTWPAADQWVFVRVAGGRRIAAVSNLGDQFEGAPRVSSWCCAS